MFYYGLIAIGFIIIIGILFLIIKGILKWDNKSRKTCTLIIIGIIFISFGFKLRELYIEQQVIGTYKAVGENDTIMIDDDIYKADYQNEYSSSDKRKPLGKVVPDDKDAVLDPMYVWSVKGTDEYIYVLWGHDGTFFKKLNY